MIACLTYGGLIIFQKLFRTNYENDLYIKDLESNRDGSILTLIDLQEKMQILETENAEVKDKYKKLLSNNDNMAQEFEIVKQRSSSEIERILSERERLAAEKAKIDEEGQKQKRIDSQKSEALKLTLQ